jgi:hypothetical protein
MFKEKLEKTVEDVKNKSNSDLVTSRDLLMEEFNKTKDIIIELTYHLEKVENSYNIINEELNVRTKNK